MLLVLSFTYPISCYEIELGKKSVIKFGWGMMFDYYGQMLHGLNKYNLIVGMKLPQIEELKLEIPYLLNPAVCNNLKPDAVLPVFQPVCKAAVETQSNLRQRLTLFKVEIEDLLTKRIPFVLRRFTPKAIGNQAVHHTRMRTPTEVSYHLSASEQTRRIRKRRFVSQLIGLGIQGISAYLEYRETTRFEKGLQQLLRHNNLQDNEIRAIKKDMLSLTKATVKDLRLIKYDIRQHVDMINRLTLETDQLVTALKNHEKWITDVKRAMIFFNNYFSQVYFQLNKYLDLFKELKSKLQHCLRAIEMVGMNRLSTGLIPNERLVDMIEHVKEQLSEHYPNFKVVTDNEQDYYQMPLISAVYVQDMIVLQIPIYIKPVTQKPLLMYKIKTIPVPYHINEKMIDSDELNYTYTEIIDTAEMIAMSDETYVDVKIDDLDQCIKISTVYFCERLMLIKHRSQHTCESAIYHNEKPEIVKEKCMIRYYTHLNPKPMMIDSGDMLLLGNLPRPWITRCDKNIQIPETLQAGSYVIVYKHELCECSIMAGNPVWKVERNINYCRENTMQIHLYHTVNMAVMIYQFQEEIKTMKLSADTLSPVPIELDPKEPGFYSVKKGEIAKEQDKPLLLEEAMASIENTKYLSSEDYILEMNKMNTWFTESNRTMGFMLVVSIVVCFLIPLVILIVVKYFGLKVHFGKMNSTLGKLVTTASALQVIGTTEATTFTGSNQLHIMDLTTNAIFAYEVLLILLVTYGLYKVLDSIYRWYNFHNLSFVQTQETLYKYLLFDKTDIFLQLTHTFGTRLTQIYLGTFFGNPEDIKITGKLSDKYPLELEHGYLLDIISFNWNSFTLQLRGMPLVLPLSLTLTGFNRIFIRKIFQSPDGMYKILACNKVNCHLTVLQPYTKIQNKTSPKPRRPTKPLRLNLTEPLYIDMTKCPRTPQPTNVTIQQLFANPNRSCVPIDCDQTNGTDELEKGYSSNTANSMGDQPSDANMVGRKSQEEVTAGSTVQRSGQTGDIVTNTSSEDRSETTPGSHNEDTINTVGRPEGR